MCISLDISILILRFGDRARVCRVDTPTNHQKQTCCSSTKVSWLFVKLSDNASDDGLSLSASVAVNKQILEVILMPDNDAILNSWHTKLMPVIFNYGLHFVKSIPINDSLKEAI